MNNLKLFLFAALILTVTSTHAYYSADSYEGTVSFTAVAQIDDLLSPADTLVYINQQLLYLAGPLQAAPKKSGPKSDAQLTVLEKFRDSQTGKMYARYQYTGTFVLENAIQGTVAIHLPYDFSTIFTVSNDACFSHGNVYRYAYYWNPVGAGCNLIAGQDYLTVQANISKKANTTNTYPSYERLTNTNGEIRAILVFGADQDANGYFPPDTNKDWNAANFKAMRAELNRQGFSGRPVSQNVREQECGGKSLATAPGFVEEYTRQDQGRNLVVRIFWGVANLGDESSAFYCLMKEAAEKSSVFLYNGHSRVGGLDLSYMSSIIQQPIQMNINQYQIFGFFGCSSYGYYNLSYFAPKATNADPSGSQNLDLITNGIAGSFGAMADNNIKTLTPIFNWSRTGTKASWQQIMNSYSEKFLTGVNGDE